MRGTPDSLHPAQRSDESVPDAGFTAFRDGAFSREARMALRDTLAVAFREHFPERSLTPAQLDRLTDAMLRIRQGREVLSTTPTTRSSSTLHAAAGERIAASMREFEEVSGVPLQVFTAKAERDIGVTSEESDDEIIFERLPPPR